MPQVDSKTPKNSDISYLRMFWGYTFKGTCVTVWLNEELLILYRMKNKNNQLLQNDHQGNQVLITINKLIVQL